MTWWERTFDDKLPGQASFCDLLGTFPWISWTQEISLDCRTMENETALILRLELDSTWRMLMRTVRTRQSWLELAQEVWELDRV